MSRTVIVAVVAAVIAILTGIAFFVTSTSFEDRLKKDADAKLLRAHQVVQQLNQLEGIDISNKAERLAAQKEFVTAIKTDSASDGFTPPTPFRRYARCCVSAKAARELHFADKASKRG